MILYFYSINKIPNDNTLKYLKLSAENVSDILDKKFENTEFNQCFINYLFQLIFCEIDEIRNLIKEFFFTLGEQFGKDLKQYFSYKEKGKLYDVYTQGFSLLLKGNQASHIERLSLSAEFFNFIN